MKRKPIVGLIAIVAVVAVAMFAGCVEEEIQTTPTQDKTQSDGYETITVVWESGKKSNLYKITGESYYFPYGTDLFKAENYYERTIYTDEDERIVWLDIPNGTYYYLTEKGEGLAGVEYVHRECYGTRKPTQSLSSYKKSLYDPFNYLIELNMKNSETGVESKGYTFSKWPVAHNQSYILPYGAKIWQKRMNKDEYYEYGTVVGYWARQEQGYPWRKLENYIVFTWNGEVDTWFTGVSAGFTYSKEKPIECLPQVVMENPEIAGYPADMVFSGETIEDEVGKEIDMREHIEKVVREKYLIEK